MSSIVPRFVLATSLLATSTVVLARDYPDDANVSTMKGHLVEVGDRNKFHHDFPRLNLSLNPFGILTGTYSVSGSYAITDNIAARGDLSYTESSDSRGMGYEVGAGAQIFFKKMYNGLYLEPGLVRKHETFKIIDEVDWNYDVFGPQVLVGYSWFWDSGFNVQLAGGVGRNLMKSYRDRGDAVDSGDNIAARTFGNAYFRVGYAF